MKGDHDADTFTCDNLKYFLVVGFGKGRANIVLCVNIYCTMTRTRLNKSTLISFRQSTYSYHHTH